MTDFVTAVRERLLVCDGAMGTMLHAAGNSLDRALPELNLSDPDLVSTVHDSYVDAGADIILTNTFGANRLRLAEHGHAGDVAEINHAGARLARQAAAAAGRTVFVGGSVSPAVSAGQRQRVPAADRVEAVREQVRALAEAGVDLLVLETFGYLGELTEAVLAAAELSDLPILAQATFTAEGSTPGGETPREVAVALSGLPIAALGANCTVGPQRMLDVVKGLLKHTTLPVSAQPNAGLPRRRQGRRFEYSLDHDYLARYARRCAEQGASIIGGCCGTTPAHIRAMIEAVSDLDARRPAGKRPPRPVRDARPATTPKPGPGLGPEQGDLAQRLAEGRFVIAAEISPPPGGAMDEAADRVLAVRDAGIDLVVVSAARRARAQVASAGLAMHLRQRIGVETVTTVTTWDKTIMTLQADLLGVHAFGMRTIVCETGNPPLRGDYPNVDGIWDVDSVGLVELLSGLNAGRDCDGLSLATKTSFHIGARCNPGAENLAAEIARTRAKIAAGAQFLITRPVYELTGLRRMLARLAAAAPHTQDAPGGGTAPAAHGAGRSLSRGAEVPVLVAVSPLTGFTEAEYLAYEVPDVTIPASALAALEKAGDDGRETGLRLAAELVAQARDLADGVVMVVRDDDASDMIARLAPPAAEEAAEAEAGARAGEPRN